METDKGTSSIVAAVIERAGAQARSDLDAYRILLAKLAKRGGLDDADQARLATIVRDQGFHDRLRADAALSAQFQKAKAEAALLADAINEQRAALEAEERVVRDEQPKAIAAINARVGALHRQSVAAGNAVRRAQEAAFALVNLHQEHADLFGECDRTAIVAPPGAKRFKHKIRLPECMRVSLGGDRNPEDFIGGETDAMAPASVFVPATPEAAA